MGKEPFYKVTPMWKLGKDNVGFGESLGIYKRAVEKAGGADSIGALVYHRTGECEKIVVKEFQGITVKELQGLLMAGKDNTEDREFGAFIYNSIKVFGKKVKDPSNYIPPIHETFVGYVIEKYKPGGVPKPIGIIKKNNELYVLAHMLEGYIALNKIEEKQIGGKEEYYERMGRLVKRIGKAIGRFHASATVTDREGKWALFFFHGDLHPGNVMIYGNSVENNKVDVDIKFIDLENSELWVLKAQEEVDVVEAYMEVLEKRKEELRKFVAPNSPAAGIMKEVRNLHLYPQLIEGYIEGLKDKNDVIAEELSITENDITLY